MSRCIFARIGPYRGQGRGRPSTSRDDGRRQVAQLSALTPQQQRDYERDGFLVPFAVLAPAEVERFRRAYDELESHFGPTATPLYGQCHLHFRWAFELAIHPKMLDVVEDIVGSDILVHTTTLFCKQPHDPAFVSWHQDAYTWRLDNPRLVTAWVALTESTPENGCMRALPRTHREGLPHEARPHPDNMLATGLSLAEGVDESRAVDFVLEPGQMSLHHALLVHGSHANRSAGKRIGFAIRYVSPSVWQERPHHAVVLARGQDAYGHYESLDRLPSGDLEEGLAAHYAFWHEIAKRGDRPDLSPSLKS
jgi:non-haem Fe2+, alpha-ketoglutarate-dependent halogenase